MITTNCFLPSFKGGQQHWILTANVNIKNIFKIQIIILINVGHLEKYESLIFRLKFNESLRHESTGDK